MTEATLALAQAGDGEAFRELIDPHRRELPVHCYRILRSLQDAEDVLQEALLAAWRSIDRFDGRSLRAWLYRIATNRCLNFLRGESRRPRPAGLPDHGANQSGPGRSDDPWWLEPFPDSPDDAVPGPEARYDARESIALSFVAGLQRLPPRQRAVLLLRDVLGFPASETAGMLGTSQAAVNSALLRARAALPPDQNPHEIPVPKSPAEAAIVDRFVNAFQRFDVQALITWRGRFADRGLDGLADAPRPGRPRRLRQVERVAVAAVATSAPPGPAAVWTHAAIAARLTEQAISVSASQVGRILAETDLKPHRVRGWHPIG